MTKKILTKNSRAKHASIFDSEDVMEKNILAKFERLIKSENINPDLAMQIVSLDYCPYSKNTTNYYNWQRISRNIKRSGKHTKIVENLNISKML